MTFRKLAKVPTRQSRQRNPRRRLLVLACALFAAGCAAGSSHIADEAMKRGDWEEAAQLLRGETLAKPNHAKTWARLGECQYHTSQYDDARTALTKALSLDASMSTAHLFLGYIDESEGNVDDAIWQYQTFLDVRPDARQAGAVTRRMVVLRRAQAQQFARHAIAEEKNLSPESYSDSTIGVVYFRATELPDSLRPLTKGLAVMVMTDLSRVKSLRVVERMRMQELLRELSLSASSAFDADQAPRFGKLLGATHVLGGKLALLGTGRLQVDPQLVRATTGDVTLPDEQSGTLSEFFSMEKRVVYSVLEQLGITLSLAERDSIEIMPTQSFDAFLAYSRGINYEDHGQYDLAHEEFTRAIKLDPAFQDARARAAESQYMIGATGTDESVETFAQETSKTTEWGLPAVATDRRLEALLNNAGLVRVSADGTPAGDDTPYTAPAGGESQVIIRGRFDD